MNENEISHIVIGAAIEVHREMGPGLLESVYEHCLEVELRRRGLDVERQVEVPVHYKEQKLEIGFRMDLWVERKVILELKSVEVVHPLHKARLLNYLKLMDNKLGLMLNFNVLLMRSGNERVVNGL